MMAAKSALGTKVLSYLMAKAVDAAPSPNLSQAGIAGAVPSPDPAPITGGPHADASIANTQEPDLTYVNDWDATNFHMQPNGTLADLANSQMSYLHGSNGESYGRK